MKKLGLLAVIVLSIASCKKDHQDTPDDQEVITPPKDPLLFGQIWTPNSNGVVTVWNGKTRDTNIVAYKHDGLIVTGFYEKSVVSPGGIAKGIVYYGNEVQDGKGSRLCQFLQQSTPFAESTGRQLDPRYVEWAQGSITYKGDTYIVALGGVPGQRAKSYYYKVEGNTEKQTYHPLAQTPNGNGYGRYCGTEKGLIVCKALSPETKTTFLQVFREDQLINEYKLEIPGYIYIDIENIFARDDDNLIVIIASKKEGTPITGLFYVAISLIDHTIKTYKAEMPEVNFHINEGTYVNRKVYLPYYENGVNKCAYVTLEFDDKTNKVISEKFDLPGKAGQPYGLATLVATNGNNVYVGGSQGSFACYWRNDKLIEIDNTGATQSAITKIAVFD